MRAAKVASWDAWTWVLAVIAAGAVANAIWMLVAPGHWYHHLPAGVPDFGPLNVHFVRDIGCAFGAVGIALGVSLLRPVLRPGALFAAALFFCAHALLHVHDSVRGVVDAEHWLLDAPGVYLPAILLVLATRREMRRASLQ